MGINIIDDIFLVYEIIFLNPFSSKHGIVKVLDNKIFMVAKNYNETITVVIYTVTFLAVERLVKEDDLKEDGIDVKIETVAFINGVVNN